MVGGGTCELVEGWGTCEMEQKVHGVQMGWGMRCKWGGARGGARRWDRLSRKQKTYVDMWVRGWHRRGTAGNSQWGTGRNMARQGGTGMQGTQVGRVTGKRGLHGGGPVAPTPGPAFP